MMQMIRFRRCLILPLRAPALYTPFHYDATLPRYAILRHCISPLRDAIAATTPDAEILSCRFCCCHAADGFTITPPLRAIELLRADTLRFRRYAEAMLLPLMRHAMPC